MKQVFISAVCVGVVRFCIFYLKSFTTEDKGVLNLSGSLTVVSRPRAVFRGVGVQPPWLLVAHRVPEINAEERTEETMAGGGQW